MRATFNKVLREAGFDPEAVRLVRHQDARLGRITVYDLWRTEKGIFEYYQSIQRSSRSFPVGSQIASFVVDPDGQTLFVGLYDVLDRREASKHDNRAAGEYIHRLERHDSRHVYEGLLALLRQAVNEGDCLHKLDKRAELANHEGLLTVDWGPGMRAFVQRASRQDKPILRVRRTAD